MTSDGPERLGLPPLVELPRRGLPFLARLALAFKELRATLGAYSYLLRAAPLRHLRESHISQNIDKLRCYGIIVGDPISFETSIILQLCKLFRYRHFHDKGPEFPYVDEPSNENNISSCIMKVVKFDGFTG